MTALKFHQQSDINQPGFDVDGGKKKSFIFKSWTVIGLDLLVRRVETR